MPAGSNTRQRSPGRGRFPEARATNGRFESIEAIRSGGLLESLRRLAQRQERSQSTSMRSFKTPRGKSPRYSSLPRGQAARSLLPGTDDISKGIETEIQNQSELKQRTPVLVSADSSLREEGKSDALVEPITLLDGSLGQNPPYQPIEDRCDPDTGQPQWGPPSEDPRKGNPHSPSPDRGDDRRNPSRSRPAKSAIERFGDQQEGQFEGTDHQTDRRNRHGTGNFGKETRQRLCC